MGITRSSLRALSSAVAKGDGVGSGGQVRQQSGAARGRVAQRRAPRAARSFLRGQPKTKLELPANLARAS
jgi:hypothetical protein